MSSGPYNTGFNEIKWNNGFERWDLVRFKTPADGNCLFHSICNSFYIPYRTGVLEGKNINRTELVRTLRSELARKLAMKLSDEKDAPTYYSILNKGNTSLFSKEVPEFTLEHMQRELDSSNAIGYGYIEFIGNVLNKDIYILDGVRKDIYISDELPLTIKGNRNSIVLYYTNGHYELVGIRNSEGFDTYFDPNHSFIKFLYNRVSKIVNKS
ncbi:MAG: hypothetical protein QW303_01920 [Nitrososphaerota archaeon]